MLSEQTTKWHSRSATGRGVCRRRRAGTALKRSDAGEEASAAADGCLGRLAQHPAAVGKAPGLLGRGKGAERRCAGTVCRSVCRSVGRSAWAVSSSAGLARGDPAGGAGGILRLGMELAGALRRRATGCSGDR